MTAPFGQIRLNPKDPRFNERVAEHFERLQNGELVFRQLSLAGAEDLPVRTVAVTSTLLETDRIILGDAGGGAVTLTLPVALGRRRRMTVKRLNAGANVTVAAAGTDTIDGAASVVLTAQWQVLDLIADGISAWFVL